MANPSKNSLHAPKPNENSTYTYMYVRYQIYIFVNRGLIKSM